MEKKKKLTEKEQLFVKHYLITLNAKKAAILAKYSERSAAEIGYENLNKPHIQDALRGEIQKVKEKLDLDKDYVLKGLMEVVERSMRRKKVMYFDYEEKEYMQRMDEETGEGVWEYDSGGVNKALELLGKHLQLFTDRLKIEGESFSDIAKSVLTRKSEEETEKKTEDNAPIGFTTPVKKIKVIKKNG